MVKKLIEPDKTILVNDKSKHTCLIPLKDIHYVMAFQHNTVIYTSKGEITCTVSFNKMEELLGTQFFKIHRSYTINREYIRLFGPDYVELTTGEKVPMTKRNRAQLISSLMDCTNIQSGIDDDAKK
ncbi:LytR/AlgR family response regulator transcription factor [Catenibacterium sp.]